MMADFPPNVEDGELWLPSDVFPDEIYRPNHRPTSKLESEFSSCELTSSMEELAHQLAFAILDDAHHNHRHHGCYRAPDHLPHFTRFSQVKPQRNAQGYARLDYPGFQVRDIANKPVQQSVSRPVLGSAPLVIKPAHHQSRSLSRGLPLRVVGSGGSGFIRESGGTGVFLPRVVHSDVCIKSKTSVKLTEEPSRNAGGGGDWRPFGGGADSVQSSRRYQRHQHHHPPSDMALPSEWTY